MEGKNPWMNSSSTYISMGSLKVAKSVSLETSNVGISYIDESRLHSCPSLQLIDMLQNLSEKSRSSCEIRQKLQRQSIDRECRSISSMDAIDRLIDAVENLSSHLQDIVNKKQTIINQLQRTFSGSFLLLDASFQNAFLDVINEVCRQLSSLPLHLESIDWITSFDPFNASLQHCLNGLSERQLHLQHRHELLSKTRRLMEQRLNNDRHLGRLALEFS